MTNGPILDAAGMGFSCPKLGGEYLFDETRPPGPEIDQFYVPSSTKMDEVRMKYCCAQAHKLTSSRMKLLDELPNRP